MTVRRLIAPALVAGAIAACSGARGGADAGQESGVTVATRSIDEVLATHTDSLLALPGVIGTAIALYDGERCIKVLLADSSAVAAAKIPRRLEGYRVVVEVVGTIRPRNGPGR